MYSRRNLEFRIRKHFFPNLTHFCFSQHPFAKAVRGQLSCPDSSLTLHIQFIYMFFVLVFKIRAQIHTLVSISLPLYKSKSPYCHHHIGFSCLLLLSPICFAYSSQSNNLKAKIELLCHHLLPFSGSLYKPVIQLLLTSAPLSYSTLPCFSCLVSLASSYFLEKIPNLSLLQRFPIFCPFYLEHFSFCRVAFLIL